MEYIIEFIADWSDGVSCYEQTVSVRADDKASAVIRGKRLLFSMDENDNQITYTVSRRFVRCVEASNFEYTSSAKDRYATNDKGAINAVGWKGL